MDPNETPTNEPTPEATPDPRFTVDDSTKEFLEQYVGPGKKYSNIGELAKGYYNADRHLFEVTRDAGKFKTEAESLKELLMENLVPKNEPDPNSNPNPNESPNEAAPQERQPANEAPPKEGGEVDLRARVKEVLNEVTTEERYKNNSRITEDRTIEHFGDKEKAVAAIAAKAAELDVSPQWIANLAFESPKAFFAAMGIPETPQRSTSTPASGSSDVNAQRLAENHPGVRPNTYAWYQELRKSNPAKYRTQEVQQAILRDAASNPNFYS